MSLLHVAAWLCVKAEVDLVVCSVFSETSALDVGACGGLECLLVRDCLGAGECVAVFSVFWGLECVFLGVDCVWSSAVCWSRSMFRCLSVFLCRCVSFGSMCVWRECVFWLDECRRGSECWAAVCVGGECLVV